MVNQQESISEYVISLLNNGQRREEIEAQLMEKGHEETFVKEIVVESIKLRDSKRRSQALALVLSGAVICFLSFLLTITSSFSHGSFGFVLYGLTSLGIVVVFAGLMKVF